MRNRCLASRAGGEARRAGRLLGGLIGLLLASLIPMSAAGQDRFPESLWSAELLERLRSGPSFLPADLDLGVPPPPSEAETRAELDRLERLVSSSRDEETTHLIRIEADASLLGMMRASGLIPDRGSAPALWGLLTLVETETGYFVLREKREHARPRPNQVRPALRTLIRTPPHPSYPSGHAAQSAAIAGLLGALNPACAETYRTYAAGVGERREIAGVHFPSDTRAGVKMAEALLPHLLLAPRVAAEIPRARAELAAQAVGCEGGVR